MFSSDELIEKGCLTSKQQRRVDSTRALLSLSKAIHHSTYKEAKSFFESAGAKLIWILLEYLDIGDVSSREEDAIKSCFQSALKIVALDLADTSMTQSCGTLSLFTVLFDEVCGYQKGKHALLDLFRNENGFAHLANYLHQLVGTNTFPLGTIPVILNVLECEQKSSKHNKIDASVLTTILSHLNSLDEGQCSDDCIDICRKTSGLAKLCLTHIQMATNYSLLQDFVLKLVQSSSIPLKLMGLEFIPELISFSTEQRPKPSSFVVKGATKDIVNGIYTSETNDMGETEYVRTALRPEGLMVTLTLCRSSMYHDSNRIYPITEKWCIVESDYDGDEEVHYTTHVERGNEFPPHSGWRIFGSGSTDSDLSVSLTGDLTSSSGDEFQFVCLEFSLWDKIYENNILDMICDDCLSKISDIRDEAINAGENLLCSLGPLLDWINGIFQMSEDPLELQPELHHKRDTLYRAVECFTVKLLRLLLRLSDEAFQTILPDFIVVTIERIEKALERIGSSESQFEYNMASKLLMMRLKTIYKKHLDIEVDEIPGLALKPSRAFIVSDANFSANGRYTLDEERTVDSRFVTYSRKYFPMYSTNDAIYTMKQQLFGADKGVWVISRSFLDRPADSEIIYTSRSIAVTPPQSNWSVQGNAFLLSNPRVTIGSTEDQETASPAVQKVLSVVMTGAQNQVCTMIDNLSRFVTLPTCDRSDAMKAGLEHCLTSLYGSTPTELHSFIPCALKILNEVDI